MNPDTKGTNEKKLDPNAATSAEQNDIPVEDASAMVQIGLRDTQRDEQGRLLADPEDIADPDEVLCVVDDTEQRSTFDVFKSAICHQVKSKGDLPFVRQLLETDMIRMYFNREWYRESLYLLAMLDYLSRENNLPRCKEYNDLRCMKFSEPIYSLSVIIAADLTHDDSYKEKSIRDAIPEFLRHNIVEGDVRNVV